MYKYLSKTIMMAAAIVLAAFAQNVTTFTDKRDGKTYKKVTIGKQVWMAENLNYAAMGSKCYESKADNCAQYGRLYDWNTALKACPAEWHLPSDDEWNVLMVAVGGVKDKVGYWQGAGKKLKSASGWNEGGNGTDAHGFSALPGGYGYSGGNFDDAGNYGLWWSATEYNASYAWNRNMYYGNENVSRGNGGKTSLFAVRCAQDY